MKICVYAISKNEEQFAERFVKAAEDADLILIADTGSTDRTVAQALLHGSGRVACPGIYIDPWRFDHARNAALALVPAEMDVCVSLDLDEELQPGWRAEIERVWKPETTRLRYFFDWGVGIKFKYEKIHSRKGYYWHHPCHEYPVPDGRTKEVWADTDMLLVIHKPDSKKSRGSYLGLLKLSIEEDPHCPRNAFYYARELSFHGQWKAAIEQCDRYLALPRATWPNERCYAYRVKGRCHSELGQMPAAEHAFHMAAYEAPHTREPWCELAGLMYAQRRWPQCYAFAQRTLEIPDSERELVYTVDPEVWGAKPHDLAAISAWNLGMKPQAIWHGQIAAKLDPDNDRLQNNIEYYQRG